MDSMDVSLSEFLELVMEMEAWHAEIDGVAKNRTQMSDWTELNWSFFEHFSLNTLKQQEASLLGLRKFEYQLFLSCYIFLSWTMMQYTMD